MRGGGVGDDGLRDPGKASALIMSRVRRVYCDWAHLLSQSDLQDRYQSMDGDLREIDSSLAACAWLLTIQNPFAVPVVARLTQTKCAKAGGQAFFFLAP